MPLGMLLQAAACFTMLSWSGDSPYATMWPPFVALGLGVGMVLSASSDAIVGNAPVRDGGVAGGLQATTLQIGGALGTSVPEGWPRPGTRWRWGWPPSPAPCLTPSGQP